MCLESTGHAEKVHACKLHACEVCTWSVFLTDVHLTGVHLLDVLEVHIFEIGAHPPCVYCIPAQRIVTSSDKLSNCAS